VSTRDLFSYLSISEVLEMLNSHYIFSISHIMHKYIHMSIFTYQLYYYNNYKGKHHFLGKQNSREERPFLTHFSHRCERERRKSERDREISEGQGSVRGEAKGGEVGRGEPLAVGWVNGAVVMSRGGWARGGGWGEGEMAREKGEWRGRERESEREGRGGASEREMERAFVLRYDASGASLDTAR